MLKRKDLEQFENTNGNSDLYYILDALLDFYYDVQENGLENTNKWNDLETAIEAYG